VRIGFGGSVGRYGSFGIALAIPAVAIPIPTTTGAAASSNDVVGRLTILI
jgi:hypothetical protein